MLAWNQVRTLKIHLGQVLFIFAQKPDRHKCAYTQKTNTQLPMYSCTRVYARTDTHTHTHTKHTHVYYVLMDVLTNVHACGRVSSRAP